MKITKKENYKAPVFNWCSEIEENAMKQVETVAQLPFLHKRICIMPDCHMGYGMPIGGVVALKNVISPNMVGCFTGDTKIPLLEGLQRTLKELQTTGGSFFVYSLDENQKLVPGKATAKLTRKNAELIEIVISGGETIRCTPDHQFMLLDGTYKEAKNLNIFDSLMPLYRSYQSRDGYERIRTKSGNGVITHKMVIEHFKGKGKNTDIVHHKNGRWFDNSPSNLIYKDAKLHSKEHSIERGIFKTEEFKKKRLETLEKNGFFDEKFGEKKRNIAIENITKYNNSPKKKEQDKLAGKRGAKYLIKYNEQKNNHKVLAINHLPYKEDVYCLTVEKYHNFALASGVFVHNCDIGCGMCAVKTTLTDIDTETLKKIMGEIRKAIPVGFNKHKEKESSRLMPEYESFNIEPGYIVYKEYDNARKSLGTLGGGNHFIEIQKGDDGHIWIMIHSGSRNLGLQVCDYYKKLAYELNHKWHSKIPEDNLNNYLGFFPVDSEEGQAYIKEMNYCVEFALANRKLMMDRICKIFEDTFAWYYPEKNGCNENSEIKFDNLINIAHNYASQENHFGKNVWVHRKGATRAREGEIGIIPGSQGTSSYIVEGLGNPESFESCSHGAGRVMGRKQAERELDLEKEIKILDDQNIIHGIRHKSDLDEAVSCYKNIDEVMENQKDLVKVLVKLKPLSVVKG